MTEPAMQPANSIHLLQDQETPVTVVIQAPFAYRYAYARSADTRAAADLGQDYLRVESGPGFLAFTLCDGVSQSFYGDVAARLLGDALVAWLVATVPPTLDVAALSTDITTLLNGLTKQATQVVRNYALPTQLPDMLREVLEQKRAMGSESTFVCGRIDLPSAQLRQGPVLCAWMGDSRLRLWRAAGEYTEELGDTFKTEQRWSSRRGLVGESLHLFVQPLALGNEPPQLHLLTYSDGLPLLDRAADSLSNGDLQACIAQAGESVTSDDITRVYAQLASALAACQRAVCTFTNPQMVCMMAV